MAGSAEERKGADQPTGRLPLPGLPGRRLAGHGGQVPCGRIALVHHHGALDERHTRSSPTADDPVLDEFIRVESSPAVGGVPSDPFDGFENVEQPIPVTSHNATA